MQQKTMWRLMMVSADGGDQLTELCRSYDLRLLTTALKNSYTKLGAISINYSREHGQAHTVFQYTDEGAKVLAYIVHDTFTLLEKNDVHL